MLFADARSRVRFHRNLINRVLLATLRRVVFVKTTHLEPPQANGDSHSTYVRPASDSTRGHICEK